MKQTVSKSAFIDAFRNHGRENQFSYEALCLMYEWFNDYEKSCDTEIELHVIAICCEYAEDDWEAIADNYSIDLSNCEDDDEREQSVKDHLQYNTTFIGKTSDTMVYASF